MKKFIEETRVIKPIEETEIHESYEERKTFFLINQFVWYVLGLVEILLLLRFSLKALGANPGVLFTNLFYTITQPFLYPFQGIIPSTLSESNIFEWSVLVAMITYVLLSWAILYLLDFLSPITSEEVKHSYA